MQIQNVNPTISDVPNLLNIASDVFIGTNLQIIKILCLIPWSKLDARVGLNVFHSLGNYGSFSGIKGAFRIQNIGNLEQEMTLSNHNEPNWVLTLLLGHLVDRP